jgi:hypothetical protein
MAEKLRISGEYLTLPDARWMHDLFAAVSPECGDDANL